MRTEYWIDQAESKFIIACLKGKFGKMRNVWKVSLTCFVRMICLKGFDNNVNFYTLMFQPFDFCANLIVIVLMKSVTDLSRTLCNFEFCNSQPTFGQYFGAYALILQHILPWRWHGGVWSVIIAISKCLTFYFNGFGLFYI